MWSARTEQAVPMRPRKAYAGVKEELHSLLTSAVHGGLRELEAAWSQELFWRLCRIEEILLPLGIETRHFGCLNCTWSLY